MTVHVIVPVFNRLSMTKDVIDCLRRQQLDEKLIITVVDDGSNDGTQEFLAAQPDIHVIKGHGNLWWGGAIDLGLSHILKRVAVTDWVLFINNDTKFNDGFVQSLLHAARQLTPAAVRATVVADNPSKEILSIGTVIDVWKFCVSEILINQPELSTKRNGVVEVDVLSGRGVLYPVKALRVVGGMRKRMVPHYFADYELSLRVKRAGWKLYSVLDARVMSVDSFGSAYKAKNLLERFFSIRSPSYLPAYLYFWWSASNMNQRIIFPFILFKRSILKLVRVIK